jgi:hypothetical protein
MGRNILIGDDDTYIIEEQAVESNSSKEIFYAPHVFTDRRINNMKYLFYLVALVFVLGLASSCSTPGSESNSSALASDKDVVDITAQQASTLPTPVAIKPAIDSVDNLKETVSPGNLPKCVDQLSGAKKVIEKMKEVTGYYGEQKYTFDLGDRGYINGNPLTDMGAAVTPGIPRRLKTSKQLMILSPTVRWFESPDADDLLKETGMM